MTKLKRNLLIVLSAIMLFTFANLQCIFAGAGSTSKIREAHNGNYYFADFDSAAEAYTAGDELNKEILAEGITLLKNDNSLPLKQGAKVSVFGNRSTNLRYGGSGSGAGSGGEKITIRQSLERAGIRVNGALSDFYSNNSQSGSAGGNLSSYGVFAGPSSGFGETPVATIERYVNESTYSEYGDAAIIVFSRAGGEAGDATKGMSTGFSGGVLNGNKVSGARNYDDHYLQLDQNETDLIKYVGDHFDNVIILLNTGSQMEVGFLDDPGHYAYHENIKGALWIGYPGNGNGLEALGEILTGKINPSGHTVDTYARDFKLDPTWSNMPTYTNTLYTYSNFNKDFVNYSEGIYSGYRYYETRGYTEGEKAFNGSIHGTTTTNWNNWYEANVVYPFGYGLSYTTFEWQIINSSVEDGGLLTRNGTISIDVKVTNTGAVAGKDVVQLYYTSPYTAGGIEKAHVVLGDYVKTNLLKPGASQTVTLNLSVKDMASYDYSDANSNGFKGYEVEAGSYGIKISRNAHDVVFEKTYTVGDGGFRYTESANDEYPIENRFDDAAMDGTVYLSRNDWSGTWPHEPTAAERVAPQAVIDLVNNTSNNDAIISSDDPSDPYYTDVMPTTGANTGVKLIDLYGLDYDDPLWDKFLDQMTVGNKNTAGTMAYTLWTSGWTSYGMNNLGIPDIHHEDGPSGIAGRYVGGNYTNFASETVTASTWNREIAYKKGIIIGNQGLFANGSSQVNALYAPACNIHRTPFGGRNFEYFSEDALLSGEMAGSIVQGCNEKGMITFVKHFALNDQESRRDTCLTWANEQTIREIYLKPFRICVEKYDSHGIMSGLNNVGTVWAGGNYALLTEVLRGEWGFVGVVITDYVQNRGQLNGNQAIRGGGDILLATSGSVQNPAGLDRPTTVANMRRAMHNLCYTIVNYTAAFNKSTMNVLGSYSGGTLAPAIDSIPYEQSVATVELNNGALPGNVVYRLKEGSSLPKGLTLTESGIITGSAQLQNEAAEFTVVAQYGYATREATFTLPIVNKELSVIYVRETETIDGYVGKEISKSLAWAYTLDGKRHNITYSLESGTLPSGFTLTPEGVITGKSDVPFTGLPITVRAESEGMLPMSINLVLNVYKEFAFKPSNLSTARFGVEYAETVTETWDIGLSYSLKQGDSLPLGLTLTSNGSIVGVPLETGTKSFTVIASGNNYQTTERTFTIKVGLRYDIFEIGNATRGSRYEEHLNLAQGSNDVVYTLTEGSLPRGLTLSRDGVLQGTPLESGNFVFVVTATSGDMTDSAEFVLHVDNPVTHKGYYTGLILGIVGFVVVLAGFAFGFWFINRKKAPVQAVEEAPVSDMDEPNSISADTQTQGDTDENVRVRTKKTKKTSPMSKSNVRFITCATVVLAVMLAVIIPCAVVLAPLSGGSSSLNTFTFEAEYVYLDDFMGAGISNSGAGVNNIYGDGLESDIEKGWSNGYFLGNTYAENSIVFEITSDKDAEGKLILRLASELGNLALDKDVFGIEVNGQEIDYSITVADSASGTYTFADYPIATTILLVEGTNTIKLTIKQNNLKDGNSIGAPLIDCIRITTEASLSWNPLLDNPDRRGEV